MFVRSFSFALLVSIASAAAPIYADDLPVPVADWHFVPEYVLGGNAANHPGPRLPHPRGNHRLVEMEPTAILFQGAAPTQRLNNLISPSSLPREAFTYELWLSHHVNRPVAVLMSVRGREPGSTVPISLGFHDWESFLLMQGGDGAEVQLKSKMKPYSGFKERWVHLVATYDGHTPRMFVNGEQIGQGHMHHDELAWPESAEFELSAYMQAEPHMQLANLVHGARIYDDVLTAEQIQSRYQELQQRVHEGQLYPNLLHFTAGPYLNLTTQESLALTWETDRETNSLIEWGTTAELGQVMELTEPSRLHEATLTGLAANTAYFYRVTATDADKHSIDSGLLTFKTAVKSGQPFRFAVIGDTEARPHINDRLAKQIWGERPNFVINLGDLTDNGKEPHRYEWTHEYFVGMTQLTSRVPLFAVPGNGESDLHWYKRYHRYPTPEGYYSFRFGNAAFFMLDSNLREEQFAPGGEQYVWLEHELSQCTAQWKFVCHHHATYTGEEDDYGDSWKEQSHFGDPFVRKIVPLYEKYDVDIAMFGHLHLYERSHPIRDGQVAMDDGTVHLLAGGGGGNLEDFAPTPAFFSAKTYPGHHFVMMEIAGNTLKMQMLDLNGVIRDSFSIEKGQRPQTLKVTRMVEEAQQIKP